MSTTTITVFFAPDREYSFQVPPAKADSSSSRDWLFEQYHELECEPRTMVGKILIRDVILDVAQYGGEEHFINRDEWAKTYVGHVAQVMGRPLVRVDLQNMKLG